MFAQRRWILAGLSLLAPVLAQVVTKFPFGGDYRKELVQYATVERPDGKSRDIYISKAAVEAVRRGEPIPVGTVIAIDLHTAISSHGNLLCCKVCIVEPDGSSTLPKTFLPGG
ncbi:MAG: cytochrome P460 family protein [Deinococcota bacterium]